MNDQRYHAQEYVELSLQPSVECNRMIFQSQFWSIPVEWHLFIATVSSLVLFAMPWVFSVALRKAKRSKPAVQKRIWISGEVCLAGGLVLAFLAAFSSLVVSKDVIAPWIWETGTPAPDMEEPLTARSLFYWMTVLFSAWFVFRAVGLNALRDLHKIIKECHDLVLQNRKNELRRSSREPHSDPPAE